MIVGPSTIPKKGMSVADPDPDPENIMHEDDRQ